MFIISGHPWVATLDPQSKEMARSELSFKLHNIPGLHAIARALKIVEQSQWVQGTST